MKLGVLQNACSLLEEDGKVVLRIEHYHSVGEIVLGCGLFLRTGVHIVVKG